VKNLMRCAALLGGIAASMAAALVQGLDPAALLKPPTDTWPTYNGDYTGRRYSPLKQIDSSNVKSLTLAWAFQANSQAIKSTPLEVNGILYFSVPEQVWAIDARTGRQVWHYHYKKSDGDHIGHRGVAMWGNWLYFETPDAHLICLDAKDGHARWDITLADVQVGDEVRIEGAVKEGVFWATTISVMGPPPGGMPPMPHDAPPAQEPK